MTQIPDAAVKAHKPKVIELLNELKCRLESPPVPDLYELSDMCDAAIAALPHLPLGFEVKQLEWVETWAHGLKIWLADTYEISHSSRQGWWLKGGTLTEFAPSGLEEAKAAGQADFERRARECLVDKPVDVAAVRRQAFEEAKKAVCSGCNDGATVNQEGFHQNGFHTFPCHAESIRALSAEPTPEAET